MFFIVELIMFIRISLGGVENMLDVIIRLVGGL